jgi:hypothetical protein
MTVLSWIRFTVSLWLLRKAARIFGWLALAATAAFWPLTAVTAAGYGAAWLRGWPPARLRRAAAAAVPIPAVYLLLQAALQHSWPAAALAPARDWDHGWHQVTTLAAARTFVTVAPAAIPAGLGLASLLWGWRIYAVSGGIGGRMASAPASFDARQWRRQVRPPSAGPPPPAPSRSWPGGAVSRSAAPSAPWPAAGSRCSPCPSARAPGTWSSSARPGRGRRT